MRAASLKCLIKAIRIPKSSNRVYCFLINTVYKKKYLSLRSMPLKLRHWSMLGLASLWVRQQHSAVAIQPLTATTRHSSTATTGSWSFPECQITTLSIIKRVSIQTQDVSWNKVPRKRLKRLHILCKLALISLLL